MKSQNTHLGDPGGTPRACIPGGIPGAPRGGAPVGGGPLLCFILLWRRCAM